MSYRKFSDFKETKLTFGKYKNKELQKVPMNYLEWLVMNHSDRGICEMASVEIQRRKQHWR